MTAISQLEREATQILERLRRLEEISVPSAAKLLKKSPEFIRSNFPIIIHSTRSHHIRASDLAAYQERRTMWPQWLLEAYHDKRTIWPKNGA